MKLKEYLVTKKLTLDEASKQLGISLNYLYMLSSEKRSPGLRLAKEIEYWSHGMVSVDDLVIYQTKKRCPTCGKRMSCS